MLAREDCKFEHKIFIKDLHILNRNLKDVIIVDNMPESYLNQPENGVPIKSWFGNPKDTELQTLLLILERLNSVEDVREYIPQFVRYDKINTYKLLKLITKPRESSPLDDIIDSFKDFKKGAAAFFGFSDRKSTAEDSKETSSEEENVEPDVEDTRQKVRLRLPMSSRSYEKSLTIDSDPECETATFVGFVRLILVFRKEKECGQ